MVLEENLKDLSTAKHLHCNPAEDLAQLAWDACPWTLWDNNYMLGTASFVVVCYSAIEKEYTVHFMYLCICICIVCPRPSQYTH